MSQRFANKIAIVTGAGNGIGVAIATRLAAEGASVVLADKVGQTIAVDGGFTIAGLRVKNVAAKDGSY